MGHPQLPDSETRRPAADQELDRALRLIESLERDLATERENIQKERQKSMNIKRALANLKEKLNPMHNAINLIYSDLDAAGIEVDESNTAAAGTAPSTHVGSAKWESCKQRMPGHPAELIDLLLIHKEMTVQQMAGLGHMGKQSVYRAIAKLTGAQLLNKAGGRFSLKS